MQLEGPLMPGALRSAGQNRAGREGLKPGEIHPPFEEGGVSILCPPPLVTGKNVHPQIPVTFQATQEELVRQAELLSMAVSTAFFPSPVFPSIAATVERIASMASNLSPQDSIREKKEIRNGVWTLRQQLEGVPEGKGISVRRALEKVRGAAMDITWERFENEKAGQGFTSKDAASDRPSFSQVPNYEQLTPGLWRGGQPDADGIAWLEAHGVRTVIDLRGEGGEGLDNQAVSGAWRQVCVHSLPIPDMNAPTHEQVEEFLRLVDDPGNQPVFVHCKAGIGRTGTMIACWRIAHGWDVDEAIRRERFFSYYGSFTQEAFVREFAKGFTPT